MVIKFERDPIPLINRVFILRDSPITKSESGLLLVKEVLPLQGTVIAACRDEKYDPHELVKPGAKVFFADWAGVEFIHEGVKILSMRVRDVFGILTYEED